MKKDRDNNVEVLFGGGLPQADEPNKACIEALEELLEAARSGNIVGFTAACLHADQLNSYRVLGLVGSSMIGTLEIAKQAVFKIIEDD